MSADAAPPDVYLHHQGRQLGPYSIEVAHEMVVAGGLPPEVLAWHDGLPDWVPLSDLLPPAATIPPGPTARASIALPGSDDSFFRRLPGACVYPFKKDGWILLITGTVFFWVLDMAGRFAGLLSLVLAVFSSGYLAAYMQSIIQSSGQGEEELPRWPDFGDVYQDVVQPFLQVGVTVLVCLGPGLVVLGLAPLPGAEAGATGRFWVGAALLVGGAVYLPMALLAVAMADGWGAMSPTLVIPSILRVPGEYAATCGVLLLALALNALLHGAVDALPRIPVVSTMVQGFVGLYWLTVQMRVLGLLYHGTRQRLRWF